jgi:hypothetical protein
MRKPAVEPKQPTQQEIEQIGGLARFDRIVYGEESIYSMLELLRDGSPVWFLAPDQPEGELVQKGVVFNNDPTDYFKWIRAETARRPIMGHTFRESIRAGRVWPRSVAVDGDKQ